MMEERTVLPPQLIAAATTGSGLKVRSEIDTNAYPKGVKVEDEEMAALEIRRHEFHGECTYTITPCAFN
jgi:Rhodopirellula transposase DDE domain